MNMPCEIAPPYWRLTWQVPIVCGASGFARASMDGIVRRLPDQVGKLVTEPHAQLRELIGCREGSTPRMGLVDLDHRVDPPQPGREDGDPVRQQHRLAEAVRHENDRLAIRLSNSKRSCRESFESARRLP